MCGAVYQSCDALKAHIFHKWQRTDNDGESGDDSDIDKEILEFDELVATFFGSDVFVDDSSFFLMCDNVDKDEDGMAEGDAAMNGAPVVDLTLCVCIILAFV